MEARKIAICDECKSEIDLVVDRFTSLPDKEADGSFIRCDFLRCPECGKRYPILIHDKKTDSLIEKMKHSPISQKDYFRKKIDERQAELKKRYGFE